MFTYEYAAKSKKNLTINLLLNAVKSFVIDVAFIAVCFLIMLVM